MRQRLAGAWRRLVAPPRPALAMERFLRSLAETPYDWRLACGGKIRTHEAKTELCVITGVVRHRTGIDFSVGDWVLAADTMGLSYREAGLVVEAADHARPSAPGIWRLRQRLLVAARIEASAPSPPVASNPMDEALADLLAGQAPDDGGFRALKSAPHPEDPLARV
jgi:hypothetical protein